MLEPIHSSLQPHMFKKAGQHLLNFEPLIRITCILFKNRPQYLAPAQIKCINPWEFHEHPGCCASVQAIVCAAEGEFPVLQPQPHDRPG